MQRVRGCSLAPGRQGWKDLLRQRGRVVSGHGDNSRCQPSPADPVAGGMMLGQTPTLDERMCGWASPREVKPVEIMVRTHSPCSAPYSTHYRVPSEWSVLTTAQGLLLVLYLQMGKLRPRGRWQSQDLNPDCQPLSLRAACTAASPAESALP